MFANIKNGQTVKRSYIIQNKKKICESFLNILWEEGFILGYQDLEHNSQKIKIFLKYNDNKPVIRSLNLISKPSRRIYYSINQIWKIKLNSSLIILSTNKGLKTLIECKKLGIGGEPLLIIN